MRMEVNLFLLLPKLRKFATTGRDILVNPRTLVASIHHSDRILTLQDVSNCCFSGRKKCYLVKRKHECTLQTQDSLTPVLAIIGSVQFSSYTTSSLAVSKGPYSPKKKNSRTKLFSIQPFSYACKSNLALTQIH